MTGNHHSSSIGIDALYQYAGTGAQMFSGVIFYIVILRMFNTKSVGAIALFLAIIGLFSIVFTFGLNVAAQHFTSYNIGRGEYEAAGKTFTKILEVSFILALLGFVTLLVSSPVISVVFLHSMRYAFLIRLLSLDLLAVVLFGVLNGVLLGMQNFRLSATVSIVIWVAYYLGAIILAFFIHTLELIIIGWIIGMFIGVFVLLGLIMRTIVSYNGPAKAPSNKILFAYSFPILFSAIVSYGASYADRFVVAGLMDLSSLGVYNLSLLVVVGITFIAAPFANILLPKFSEFYGKGDRGKIAELVRASGLLLSTVYVPAALGISALSPMIVEFIGGGKYMDGYLPLSIIMFFSAIFILRIILVQAMASVRRTNIFIRASAIGLSANILLSVLLIPKYDLIGAAIGFSSVYATTFFVLLFYARKESIVSFEMNGLLKVWTASIIMFLFVTGIEQAFGHSLFLLPIYIVSGACVYTIISMGLRIFTKSNKEFILSLFPSNDSKIRRLLSIILIVK